MAVKNVLFPPYWETDFEKHGLAELAGYMVQELNNNPSYDETQASKNPCRLNACIFNDIQTKIGKRTVYIEFMDYYQGETVDVKRYDIFKKDNTPNKILDRMNELKASGAIFKTN